MYSYSFIPNTNTPSLTIQLNPDQFCPEKFDKCYTIDQYGAIITILFDLQFRESKEFYRLFKLFKTYSDAEYCRDKEIELRRYVQFQFYSKTKQLELFIQSPELKKIAV
jgi:hypothetical protein